MQEVKKSALIAQPCEDIYSLVTDIESYPQFIQWCNSSEVLEQSTVDSDAGVSRVVANVGINYRGVQQSFTTENINTLNKTVEMRLHEGAEHWLKSLNGVWRFTDLGAGTKVELEMTFDIANGVLSRVVNPVFNHVVSSQLDAFVNRANQMAQA